RPPNNTQRRKRWRRPSLARWKGSWRSLGRCKPLRRVLATSSKGCFSNPLGELSLRRTRTTFSSSHSSHSSHSSCNPTRSRSRRRRSSHNNRRGREACLDRGRRRRGRRQDPGRRRRR
ncbi:unnamed protein product, partial [Ectocarpus sp. 12 AP-2014]